MRLLPRVACALGAAGAVLCAWASSAEAGSFDPEGHFVADPGAVAGEGFDGPVERFLPPDSPAECAVEAYTLVEADDAVDGAGYLHVAVGQSCAERFEVALPAVTGSYRATVWMRHGTLDAQMTVLYPDGSGLELVVAKMAPTGRVTSDGWVELASNEFPVDGALAEHVYLRVIDMAALAGADVDALELVPAGDFVPQKDCAGVGDLACSAEEVCVHQRCRLGRLYVPPLPPDGQRDRMVDQMSAELRIFFGAHKTRTEDLPVALARLETLRGAKSAWEFWSGWGHAFRSLHDWHTSASTQAGSVDRSRRLDLCFIEGDGDASQAAWPKHPLYDDILVSHTGPPGDGTHGLRQGDRLVAVDGRHPIEWARGLQAVDWGSWQACDDGVFGEYAERMRGLILAYATTFSVIHCDAAAGTCAPTPETYQVAELPVDGGSQVACDNRPFYHLESGNPGANHGVGWQFFRGRIAGTTEAEAIYGMVWDTLYGGGDPAGWVNSHLIEAVADFRASARGVILDHRAGNGGTLDAPGYLIALVRPPLTLAVFPSYMQVAGDDGPDTPAEGLAFFDTFASVAAWKAGSTSFDPELPVALILHRDGSASDYFPHGMKGAGKVRLFGPHPTAGAFSTFIDYGYWGGVSWQFASGDTVGADGTPLLGTGVAPDEVVLPRQSDLLAGKDSLHEAALAWVRASLKP
ncbi:MAG: hypothetical protein IT373_14740 [Polyangiaceae bacterium]|nr:hypothetical protein [Polyangiaceae bacterium]